MGIVWKFKVVHQPHLVLSIEAEINQYQASFNTLSQRIKDYR